GGRGPRSLLEAVITDGTGRLTLAFFHNTGYHLRELRPGRRGMFAGKVSTYRGKKQLAHPVYEMLPDDVSGEGRAQEFAERPIPIYPATKGVSSMGITRCVAALLGPRGGAPELDDPMPAAVPERQRLVGLGPALEKSHRPDHRAAIGPGRSCLMFVVPFLVR